MNPQQGSLSNATKVEAQANSTPQQNQNDSQKKKNGCKGCFVSLLLLLIVVLAAVGSFFGGMWVYQQYFVSEEDCNCEETLVDETNNQEEVEEDLTNSTIVDLDGREFEITPRDLSLDVNYRQFYAKLLGLPLNLITPINYGIDVRVDQNNGQDVFIVDEFATGTYEDFANESGESQDMGVIAKVLRFKDQTDKDNYLDIQRKTLDDLFDQNQTRENILQNSMRFTNDYNVEYVGYLVESDDTTPERGIVGYIAIYNQINNTVIELTPFGLDFPNKDLEELITLYLDSIGKYASPIYPGENEVVEIE